MNTYSKYCPNVWVAKCDEQHTKGECIDVETKHGKVNECIVWNYLGRSKDDKFLYSITRADGYDHQERARQRAERLRGWAAGHAAKSEAAFTASEKATEGIPFGQPILVGHHSERAHRKAIDTAWRNMDKCVAESKKAEAQEYKATYWDQQAEKIDLSMPESIEYFAYRLEKAKEYHEGLKSGKYPREHAYSLTYAKKEVNDMQSNYDTAVKLWGDQPCS